MKKIIFLLLCFFILTSCWDSTNSDDTSTTQYTNENFKLNILKSWTIVDNKNIPEIQNGKVELAVSSSNVVAWFAENLVILSEDLKEKTESKRYSIVNYALSTSTYLEFTKLNEKSITFPDKDESNLYIFEAKYNTATPKRRFLQTAKVCDKKVYLITIWVWVDTINTAKYEDLITSFECVKK